ncbi:MAG: GAF domain-containing protein [Acidobacteria bacterium]|nr:GAF domain-containing protein [Acidobacteriota bacterium]
MSNQRILRAVDALIEERAAQADWMKEICTLLQRERQHYHWVDIYFLEGNELVLGPYVGAPSPHTRIPLDKGICGAAVREGHTVIVPDVNADPRYLACSLETKSEIVVPIEANGRILGEIDIDSHTLDAFQADDHALLEQVAARLAPVLADLHPPGSGRQAQEAVRRG